jgi:hypothetical protein
MFLPHLGQTLRLETVANPHLHLEPFIDLHDRERVDYRQATHLTFLRADSQNHPATSKGY